MSAKPKPFPDQNNTITGQKTRLLVVHGDKGGVGKSVVAQALIDYLSLANGKVAVIDADTANPDVSRMFAESVPSIRTNLRNENSNGWMDVVDFVMSHNGYTIVLNTPSGISDSMKVEMASFATFLAKQKTPIEIELWWVMNIQHDSVNLLNAAYKNYGEYFSKIRVICNLFFSNGDQSEYGPYFLWHESPLKVNLEKKNGSTLYFPALHGRIVKKIYDPEKIMPFSQAVDAVFGEMFDFSTSERWKLQQWISDVNTIFFNTLNEKSTGPIVLATTFI